MSIKISSNSARIAISFLILYLSGCHGDSSGNVKDITYARPKHLRYPSYKSFAQQNTSSEDSREHLDSQESKVVSNEQKRSYQNTTRDAKSAAASSSSSSPDSGSQQSNLKRSLPPLDQHKSGSSSRFGGGGPISLTKASPDLQFGLSFTVPFVSLSTDKLINSFSGRHSGGYNGGNDVSSILKLNAKGLILAAVVGIAAILFLPGILSGGGGLFPGLGGLGWGGGSILDSILPHAASLFPGLAEHLNHGGGGGGWDGGENPHTSRPFGYQDYYEYNGVHNHNRMDEQGLLREKSSRREARSGNNIKNRTANVDRFFQNIVSSVTNQAKKYISRAEGCLHFQVCQKAVEKLKKGTNRQDRKSTGTSSKPGEGEGKEEDKVDLIELIESISTNDLVKGTSLSDGVKKAHEYGRSHGKCDLYEKPECKVN